VKRVILLSVSILLICLAYSFAEVPCKINYQGRLIKDNVPVDGTRTMKFSIYDSAVGPTLLWTSGNVSVAVHNGLFRYVIGSGVTDLSGIPWTAGQALYLEVQVGTDILTPREELSAYPYAINSHLLEGEAKEYFINTSAGAQTKQGNLNIMGNVGIGTTDPQGYKLYVAGDILSSTGKFYNVDKDDYIEIRASDESIRFFTQEAEKLTILNSGNVGIGTTSPGEKLDVNGNIDVSGNQIKNYYGFPEPDYDSGWIPKPANFSTITLTHNLGTRDFKHVAVTGSNDASGTYPIWVVGVTSSGGGQYGNAVQAISDNQVKVSSYKDGSMYIEASGFVWQKLEITHIRVKIWK